MKILANVYLDSGALLYEGLPWCEHLMPGNILYVPNVFGEVTGFRVVSFEPGVPGLAAVVTASLYASPNK